MHYGKLNQNIALLDPREVSLKRVLPKMGGYAGAIYIASLQGKDVVIKPPYSTQMPYPSSFDNVHEFNNIIEANALYELQGGACVPQLYGVLEGDLAGHVTSKRGEESVRIQKGAIAEQFAKGRSLSELYNNAKDGRFRGNEEKSKPENLWGDIDGEDAIVGLPSLVEYFKGTVQRDLIDTDLKLSDIITHTERGKGSGLLKVDYGFMVHVSGEDQNKAYRYEYVMRSLVDI